MPVCHEPPTLSQHQAPKMDQEKRDRLSTPGRLVCCQGSATRDFNPWKGSLRRPCFPFAVPRGGASPPGHF